MSKLAVGLDFGTTHFCICVHNGIELETIPDGHDNRTFPTTVSRQGNKWDVGRHRITGDRGAWNVFDAVKRVIGRDSSDPELQKDIERLRLPYELRNGKPHCAIEDESITALEIAVLIFMKAKENFEQATGERAGPCVVTAPAYFTWQQRDSIKHAAEIAGWKPFQIVPEPTAVAVAELCRDDRRHETGLYLIVDCGGGTLDCTAVRWNREESSITILASSGDTMLGGYDFIHVLADLVVEKFPNTRREEVMSACEKAMHSRRDGDKEILIDIHNESCRLTVDEYDNACEDKAKLHSRVEKTLLDLKKSARKKDPKLALTKVLLAGGATRNPLFKSLVQHVFDKHKPGVHKSGVEFLSLSVGSEVVARGAAIIAAHHDKKDGIVIMDVLSRSLGIDTQTETKRGVRHSDIMEVLLTRHSPLPTSAFETFRAVNEDVTKIALYEGEKLKSSDNTLVDHFLIHAERGEELGVTIEVDDSGIILKARGTKNSMELRVTRMSELEESERMEMWRKACERLHGRPNDGEKTNDQAGGEIVRDQVQAKRTGEDVQEPDQGQRSKRKRTEHP